MLEGPANMFEVADQSLLSFRLPEASKQGLAGPVQPCCRGSCGSQQVLLHHESHGRAALLSLSAMAPTSGVHVAQQHGNLQDDSRQQIIQVVAHHTDLQHPDTFSRQLAVLLHCQEQPNTSAGLTGASSRFCPAAGCLAGCITPCWLVLYRVDSKLQLYAVQQQQQQQMQDPHQKKEQPAMQLLLELRHESFRSLEADSCWLSQGPMLLLQVQPEELWLLVPSTPHPVPARAAPVAMSTADAASIEPQNTWQLIELGLQQQVILQSLDHEFLTHLMRSVSAAEVPVMAASGHESDRCRVVATRPWKLLHSQPLQAGVQLLLGLEVAANGSQPPCGAATKQQQQQLGLVVALKVQVDSPRASTAEPGSGKVLQSIQIAYCYACGWTDMPVYAAVMQLEQQRQQQLVMLASSAGALQLLSCSVQQQLVQATTWQQHEAQQLTGLPGLLTKSASLLSTGKVSGPVQDVQGLTQVLAGGALHRNAWAVLHSTTSSTSAAAGTAVTLMVQQDSNLQSVAQVQGAAALIAPSKSTSLGLLCIWQQQEQAVQQHMEPDSGGLQLAALIVLDQQDPHEANNSTSDLLCYANIDTTTMKSLPGPLLGLLWQAPQVYQQPHKPASAGLDAAPGADAAAANELRGLQAMLAGLELHWQQEFLDLAALNHKLKQGGATAASAHQQLCQLAADTIQRSNVRQYTNSLYQLSTSAAVAAYHMGRQILQQQLQQQKVQLSNLKGSQSEWMLKLSLELVSHSSQLLPDVLQLQVCCKPVLQLECTTTSQNGQQHQCHEHSGHDPASNSSLSPGGCSSWWGPLLQPCHAELLMWHGGVAPVAAQSSWHWDVVTGVMTVEAVVPKSTLMQLAVMQPAISVGKNTSKAAQQSTAAAAAAAAAESAAAATGDDYVEVATATAATMTAAVAGSTASRGLSSNSHDLSGVADSCTSGDAVLNAAVVVSACCSKQAVAQVELHIMPCSSDTWSLNAQRAAATSQPTNDAVLLRSQLLKPAAALLHLPPVSVSTQQLFLHHLAAVKATAAPVEDDQLRHHADAQGRHPAGDLHTPLRGMQKQQDHSQQVTHDVAVGGGGDLPPISTSFTDADVIPPTPCDDDDGGGDYIMYDGHQQDMVVADSEAEEDADWHAAAVAAPAVAATADQPVVNAAPDTAVSRCRGQQCIQQQRQEQQHTRHQRLLLLQGPSAVLQHLPAVLVHNMCFIVTDVKTAFSGTGAPGQQAQLSYLTAAVQLLGQGDQRPVWVQLQPPADAVHGTRSNDVVELLWFSSKLLHVKLSTINKDRLHLLQHLLLLAVQGIYGAGVTCQPSPLTIGRHASFVAATDALSEAVQLQCKVLEVTLQQIHQQHLGQSADTAAGSATGQKRTLHEVETAEWYDALNLSSDGTDTSSILLVDGSPMSEGLSDCWVALYRSQGDVALAMSQLAGSN